MFGKISKCCVCDGYNNDWIILCSLFSILRSDVNINNNDLVSILSIIAGYQINIVTQPAPGLCLRRHLTTILWELDST